VRRVQLAVALAAAVGAGSGVAGGPGPGVGGGRAEGGSAQQGPKVVFTSPGPKSVTLTVCNPAGQCSSVTHTVLVLDPRPAVGGFSVTPARLEQGQSVLLDATGTGQPPLSYSWQLLHNGVVVGTLFGSHVTWPTAGQPLGAYTANLTVTNASGSAGAAAGFAVVAGSATRYFTVPPCRALDTRVSHQALHGPAGPPLVIAVGGVCGVPVGARAVAANLTAVAPTARGFVSVYPADFAHPTVSSINFNAGVTRANAGVLPLSTDGTARLAATASLVGSVDLLVDVSGYFASPAGGPPAALEFQARICPLGFCEFAAGTAIFFSQAFGGSPSEYRYDWTGSGSFTERSPAPVKWHVYTSAVGFVTPAVQVVAGSVVSTLAAATPLFISAEIPSELPAAPVVTSAGFVGYVSSSAIDPTISGPHPAYQLAIGNTPPNLYGYNVYASKNGGVFALVAALDPALPASEPVVVDDFSPPADSMRIAVSAVGFAGEGPRSAPLALTHP
jgi:PKD repeat protein